VKTLVTGIVVYETADWGARAPKATFESTTPTDMVVHHMDWPNRPLIPDYSPADHSAVVSFAFDVARRCQVDHMDSNDWSDTGQHFTVTRDGIVLEGRHGSLAALLAGHCIRGAHAADSAVSPPVNDNNSWGVEHEGTYTDVAMPDVQWDASSRLYAAIAHYCSLDTATIKGHRDTGCATECPGSWLESQLPRFRQFVHDTKAALL
jgi:hypothetical protein